MNRIRLLDPQTANGIAAGEVVERPASVVKELVENALDADASVVHVEIEQGGIRLIRVLDDGTGMDAEDAQLAFSRHATSKLTQLEDLDQLRSMGFRGEALASIAAVAQVRMKTCVRGASEGTLIEISAGEMKRNEPVPCAEGTELVVRDLFRNVPARFKFLKKDSTEAGQVLDLISRLALVRPDVSFRLLHNGNEVLHTPGNNDLASALYAVWGRRAAQAAVPVEGQTPPVRVTGLVGRPDYTRNSRDQQCFFVNGRLVRAKVLTAALDAAFQNLLMKQKQAMAVLMIDPPPNLVDINVHPQKMEVRFWNDSEVFRAVFHAVRSALTEHAGIHADVEDEPAETEVRSDAQSAAKPSVQVAVRPIVEPVPAHHRAVLPVQQSETGLPLRDGALQQLPLVPDQTLRVDDLSRARLIGGLFRTYVLLELDDDLLLVDQHAAHEKILFEQLIARNRAAGGRMTSQPLVAPLPLELSQADRLRAEAGKATLEFLGFTFDLLDGRTIALRAIPDAGDRPIDPEQAFQAALTALETDLLQQPDGISEVYYSMACKAAVKAQDSLNPAEMHRLLDDLRQLDEPYHCPHGRPVIVRIPKRELEKRFHRIV